MIPLPGGCPMKRILFRVAVLGTVVTLGLIALAQTQQRGSPPDGAGAAFVADDTAAPYASSADTGRQSVAACRYGAGGHNDPRRAILPAVRPLAGDAPPAPGPAASSRCGSRRPPIRLPGFWVTRQTVPSDRPPPRSQRPRGRGRCCLAPAAADRFSPPRPEAIRTLEPPPGGDRYAAATRHRRHPGAGAVPGRFGQRTPHEARRPIR